MPALEYLFSPMQKDTLAQSAQVRTSCRHFSAPLDASDLATLSYAIGRYAMPGARLVLMPVEESLFTGTILGQGRISGCTLMAAVIACGPEPLCRVNAGILGEAFVLEATSHGIGTCWVNGSYKRKQLTLPLRETESLLAIIALGKPETPLASPEERHRRPLERLCRDELSGTPQSMAELVRIAPSASNGQPWSICCPDCHHMTLTVGEHNLLEGGIALCHAELGITKPHSWRFSSLRGQLIAMCTMP